MAGRTGHLGGTRQVGIEEERLLTCVYLLYFSPSFRADNPTCPSLNVGALPSPLREQFGNAWSAVRSALMSDGHEVERDARVLADALAFEFGSAEDPNWQICW